MARKTRHKSLRGYRRILDEQTERARRGEIPWSDVASAAAAIARASEILLTENTLRAAGVSDVEAPDHELGEDGGANYHPGRRARPFINKKVTIKRGVNGRGEAIDEKTVTTDGEGVPHGDETDAAGE
jgi:hypothetical protein